MDYTQIDVLDQGVVWQDGAVDAAIDAPPFAGPLLVVCMDRGEDNDQFINHATEPASTIEPPLRQRTRLMCATQIRLIRAAG